jgi:DNA-binding SARP family transcriptional activator/pimeloyl-ACP methyl ester carboxylesterase
MAVLKLSVLGPPRLERDGRPVELGLRRALALLVYLAVTDRPQARDTLAAMLWPDSDESEARGRLRRTLHRLTDALGASVLVVEGDTLRPAPTADLWLDGRAFAQHAAAGLPARPGEALTAQQLEHLVQAAALYRDDFLAGFSLADNPAWDEWQFVQREHLRQRCARVLESLVAAHRAHRDWEVALGYGRRWLALDPLHEPAHRALMELYARAGQQTAALRQFQECARVLQAELGVQPEPETTALYQAIRARRLTRPAAERLDRSLNMRTTEIRYARSGDVNIAYEVVGNGPIDVVFVMGWVSHLDYFWQEPSFARFLGRLASFSRLILFDKRGTGLSDRVAGVHTLEQRMDDVRAVMDAVGSQRAALVGCSEGGSMSILFAATYPERTSALVLLGCFPRRLWAQDYPWGPTSEERQKLLDSRQQAWGNAEWAARDAEWRVPSAASDEQFKRWWATYLRMSASPGAALAVSRMNNEIDVRHVLPAIRVPTLIIHQAGDRVVPVEASRYMAERIPGARYVELPGEDHLPFLAQQTATLDEVESFLTSLPRWPDLDQVLLTLLCLEVLDTAGRAIGPGERRQREVLDAFHAAARQEIARFRGREVEAADGRVLATFDGPARAIRCGCATAELAHSLGLEARVGLHTGECELIGDKVRGIAVGIAARVMAEAGTDEVLVSGTVKDLVAGSGVQFEDLGTRPLAGIPEEWRLFRVQRGLPRQAA